MTDIPTAIDEALDLFERRKAATDRAYCAAAEALTVHFEKLLADLAKRYPKRRFRALAQSLLPGHGLAGADHVLIGRDAGLERDFVALRADLERALAKVAQ